MTATMTDPATDSAAPPPEADRTFFTDGAALRAALECASRPSKKKPHFWATMIRVAPHGDGETVIEATNGKMLVRITMRKPIDREGFVTRGILSRLKSEDRVVIDDGRLSVEEAGIDVAVKPAEALTLTNEETGERVRQWPDFDTIIPKGKRSPGAMIGLNSNVFGCVTRAAKHLSTPEYPLALRMEAGGPMDPVKFSGLSIYGEVLFLVMPCTTGDESSDSAKEKKDAKNVAKARAKAARGRKRQR